MAALCQACRSCGSALEGGACAAALAFPRTSPPAKQPVLSHLRAHLQSLHRPLLLRGQLAQAARQQRARRGGGAGRQHHAQVQGRVRRSHVHQPLAPAALCTGGGAGWAGAASAFLLGPMAMWGGVGQLAWHLLAAWCRAAGVQRPKAAQALQAGACSKPHCCKNVAGARMSRAIWPSLRPLHQPTRLLELVHGQSIKELVCNVDGRPLGLHLIQAAVPADRHPTPAAGARQGPRVGPQVAAAAAGAQAAQAAAAAWSGLLGRPGPAAAAAAAGAGAAWLLAGMLPLLPSAACCCCRACCCEWGRSLAAQRLPLHAPQVRRHLNHAHAQRLWRAERRVMGWVGVGV